MSDLQVRPQTAITPVASKYDDREMLETLKQTVAKGATDAEFKMFIEVCRSTGLNPFLKEIWCAVPMKNGVRSQYGAVLIMAGRDGYLRVANEHPMFDGMETRVDRDEKTKTPIKATCSVWRKDRSHPITCEAYFSEYYKPSYGDKPGIWDTYKSAMIGKVAEVLALKRSFSINGVVSEEEIGPQDQQGSREAQKEVAEAKIAEMQKPIPPADPVGELYITDADVPPVIEPPAKPAPDKFGMLKHFGDIKKEFIALGAEARYRAVLKEYGAEKSNQLKPDDARPAYKALSKALQALRLEKADREETQKIYAALVVMHSAERIDGLIGVLSGGDFEDCPVSERDALLDKVKAQL